MLRGFLSFNLVNSLFKFEYSHESIHSRNKKKLLGKSLRISYADFKEVELWSGFMPRRSEISTNLSNELISVALYEQNHFEAFSPSKEFVRWATVEVSDFSDVPHGMETLILPAGKYAVFDYKGTPDGMARFFQFILMEWLPNSIYELDHQQKNLQQRQLQHKKQL